MKDLIAKLQMDANCALGAIWMHIDAQAARIAELEAQQAFGIGETYANALSRIAELEAQIADWAGLVGGKDGEIYSLRQQLAVASAHQANNTNKLRQAILAILPNPPASLDKHESASYCVDFRAGLKAAAELVASTALQAPVREVPGWQPIETAPKDGREVLLWLPAPYNRIAKARWFDLWENWQEGEFPSDNDEYCGIGSKLPTHYMPLPAAPVQEPKP